MASGLLTAIDAAIVDSREYEEVAATAQVGTELPRPQDLRHELGPRPLPRAGLDLAPVAELLREPPPVRLNV